MLALDDFPILCRLLDDLAILCPDADTCTQACVIAGAGFEYSSTYDAQGQGNKLSIGILMQCPHSSNVRSSTQNAHEMSKIICAISFLD